MKNFSIILIALSVASTFLAIYGAFAQNDIWLASTQWLLVAAVLSLYAIFLKDFK